MEHGRSVLSAAGGLRERKAAGFSLIEVLIAAGILLIVALGILPLFTQAITNNQAGNDYTQATNYAKSELERLYELPFDNPELAPASRIQKLSKETQVWHDPADFPPGESSLWTRTVTIRQYNLNGLADGDGDGHFDNPLPAGAPAAFVHVKEIDVLVESSRNPLNPLGIGKRVALRTLKPF